MRKIYSLLRVTRGIKKVIDQHCNAPLWIRAEIVKLNYYNRSGHCYPDLVEKEGNKIVAQIRGSIWRSNFLSIRKRFMQVLNEPPGDGMTVVFRATVSYDPVYGLSLNITDMDPAYTLGELARQKAETISRLRSEKLFDKNKTIPVPLIPKRLAVISVNTSKGYEDFINVVNSNPWGYVFHLALFPAVLQGEKAVKTINKQLDRIRAYNQHFDAVAIIRGGGGDAGLSCYDDYSLARNIAQFPIPVLTGIGHAANQTVSEMVSCESFITPTKVAQFLLQQYHNVDAPLNDAVKTISSHTEKILEGQLANLASHTRLISSLTISTISEQKSALKHCKQYVLANGKNEIAKKKDLLASVAASMQYHSGKNLQNQNYELKSKMDKIKEACYRELTARNNDTKIKGEQVIYKVKVYQKETTQRLQHLEQKVNMLKPVNILKRGFSITRVNGKALCGREKLKQSDVIETELAYGKIESIVTKIGNKKQQI